MAGLGRTHTHIYIYRRYLPCGCFSVDLLAFGKAEASGSSSSSIAAAV